MNFICFNGTFLPADKPVHMADNRGYRYGDGLFETMKMVSGRIPLAELHFTRLFSGVKMLKFSIPNNFSKEKLLDEISDLCERNKVSELARIRLSVCRGNAKLSQQDDQLEYLIEASSCSQSYNQLNKKGLGIDIFMEGRKSIDTFSNLKSASSLVYTMASIHAAGNGLDDCLVLNTHGRVADSSIANIFLVKNNLIITPSLAEGIVDGVMRRYLLQEIKKLPDFEVREGVVTRSDLDVFDEVFLTNAIRGIRWVGGYRSRNYSNEFSRKVQALIIDPLYA